MHSLAERAGDTLPPAWRDVHLRCAHWSIFPRRQAFAGNVVMNLHPSQIRSRTCGSIRVCVAAIRNVAWAVSLALLLPLAVESKEGSTRVPREAVLATPWFRFHSDFDFNLYDAVLTSATARLQEKPDPLHGDCFGTLVP